MESLTQLEVFSNLYGTRGINYWLCKPPGKDYKGYKKVCKARVHYIHSTLLYNSCFSKVSVDFTDNELFILGFSPGQQYCDCSLSTALNAGVL